jgi:hypothetical protein
MSIDHKRVYEEGELWSWCFVLVIQVTEVWLLVKTTTEVGVRAIQGHKVIEWNTCWKCRLSEGTDDM